jgi:hypothetical protein
MSGEKKKRENREVNGLVFAELPNPGAAGGMEEITRRLDDLVRAVSDVEDLTPPPAVKDGVLRAAHRAWKARRERQRLFGDLIVADPAWDMLLDLFIARIEGRQVTVGNLSSAIESSDGTILRWAAQLIEARLVSSTVNPMDQSDRHLALTDEGLNLMCDYFLRTCPELDVAAA